MAWNTTKPATANQILEDVPDIQENLDWLKDIVTVNTSAWDGSTAANNTFNVDPRAAKTGNYTATAAEIYVEYDTSGGAATLTLPTAATKAGQRYVIKLATAGNALTVATDGSETIDGADAHALNFANEILEIISDGTNWQIIRWDFPHNESRSDFGWGSTTTITLGGAVYSVPGGQYKQVYWNSSITFTAGSGGSNSGSTDLGASQRHYLYIDDSAVDTQNTPLLDADCFLNSTTAPTYDHDKKGYYNGADRCIFGFLTDGSNNIREFFHDGGDYVLYANHITELALTDIDATWTDVDMASAIPAFSIKAGVTFLWYGQTAAQQNAYWRTNGQTGTTGHEICAMSLAGEWDGNSVVVYTDSSQIIEVKIDAGADTLGVDVNGWYLPIGM